MSSSWTADTILLDVQLVEQHLEKRVAHLARIIKQYCQTATLVTALLIALSPALTCPMAEPDKAGSLESF